MNQPLEKAGQAVCLPPMTLLIFYIFLFSSSAQTPIRSLPQGTNGSFLIDLPTTLRLARAQNLDIQIARQKLAEAQAAHKSAQLQFLPSISPGIAYRRHEDRIQDVVGDIIDADKQSYSQGATLAAQVDLGDALYKNLAARQLVRAAEDALAAQNYESILTAALALFDLTKSHAAVEVARESLRISEHYQDQTAAAVEAGLAFKGDLLRVQTQTERNRLLLRQGLEQQRLASARLAQTLHLDPAVVLVPPSADLLPLTLTPTNAVLTNLVQTALRARPELTQNKALIQAARHNQQRAVYGPLIPSLGAQAFAGALGGGRNNDLDNFGPSQDYVATLSWRIGPGGLFDSSRRQSAKAHLELALLATEKLTDEITRQVVESFTRIQSLADQIAIAQQNVQTALQTLRLTEQRKEFAVGTVLENIQAQHELTRAQLDWITAVTDYNKAQYSLHRALGKP